MAAACRRARRRPEEVKLIAVSKTFPPERIREAFQAGLRDFGENRVQEAASKQPTLRDLEITWHLVGHLQSNKARRARELFQWVHSVDSVGIARKLDQVAGGAGRLPVLLEINLGGEETKSGLNEAELPGVMADVLRVPNLELRGLMLIPPYFADPAQGRPFFQRLRSLSEKHFAHLAGPELSMGMSHDFEIAIEEGATMIRVGTAIFGSR
jgi:PLP dependent protein